MKGQTKFTLIAMLIGMFTVTAANAQDQGFIYGTVTTIDGNSYQGAIRWDDEEVYWSEMFNASKDENENLRYLSANERDYLESRSDNDSYVSSWVNITWNEDDDYDFVHQFAVPFGYIKTLEPTARNTVEVTLRNGRKFQLDGSGYNDIGSEIQVADREIGIIAIDWNRIDRVEFSKTPRKLDRKFGSPVSGTVTSGYGTFQGQIQWDHDERVGSDKLDGDTRDGDVSIAFESIRSIERQGSRGSLVTLKSGRELELRGSNDVNDENRGIIVCVEGMGQIDLDWMDFDRVDFDSEPDSGPGYDSFVNISKLEGRVETTEGTDHRGELIFDLDEAYDSEVLQGKDGESEYIIPFKYISGIKPKNWDYSTVKLKNGQEILLGDSQDVSDKNQGIIVFEKGEEVYIPWNKVKQVSF